MSILKTLERGKQQERERQWFQHSADQWLKYYHEFLLSIDVAAQSGTVTISLIRGAALAADEALKQEQERWVRS